MFFCIFRLWCVCVCSIWNGLCYKCNIAPCNSRNKNRSKSTQFPNNPIVLLSVSTVASRARNACNTIVIPFKIVCIEWVEYSSSSRIYDKKNMRPGSTNCWILYVVIVIIFALHVYFLEGMQQYMTCARHMTHSIMCLTMRTTHTQIPKFHCLRAYM